MFQHDFSKTSHYTNKADGRNAYASWIPAVGISLEDFPFTIKTGRIFKGKPIVFNIESWGCYINASGDWTLFVSYYSAPAKHTCQYSWNVGADGMAHGLPRKYEFIGA